MSEFCLLFPFKINAMGSYSREVYTKKRVHIQSTQKVAKQLQLDSYDYISGLRLELQISTSLRTSSQSHLLLRCAKSCTTLSSKTAEQRMPSRIFNYTPGEICLAIIHLAHRKCGGWGNFIRLLHSRRCKKLMLYKVNKLFAIRGLSPSFSSAEMRALSAQTDNFLGS